MQVHLSVISDTELNAGDSRIHFARGFALATRISSRLVTFGTIERRRLQADPFGVVLGVVIAPNTASQAADIAAQIDSTAVSDIESNITLAAAGSN